MIISINLLFFYICFFLFFCVWWRGWVGGFRHIGGILDMVASILADYEPERRCMTLEQSRFHGFCLKSGILSSQRMPV